MFRLLLLSIVILFAFTASDPYFGKQKLIEIVPQSKKEDVREIYWRSTEALASYLNDYDGRVDDRFTITPYYFPTAQFWFLVYTKFTSNHVVIHDRSNLNLIYKVLDFSPLLEKGLPTNALYIIQQKVARERMTELKQELLRLSKDPFSLDPEAKRLYQTFKDNKIQVPVNRDKRIKFFLSLKDGVRTQTGQKNFIRDGIVRSLPYQHFLRKFFEQKSLPIELLAIPFLESSFNPKAHSKVNALGVWQFMPLIASYYVPKRSTLFDYRSNVAVASIAAASLMSENIVIMKSWDLAVTAYNSGTKHLLKTKRKMNNKHASLEDVINNSDSGHFGFASKNFYSEFLALSHTLAYREELFDDLHDHDRQDVDQDIRFYLSKCTLRLDKTLSLNQLDDVAFHNNQLSKMGDNFPRAHILTSKTELPRSKFLELTRDQVVKTKPKDWTRFLGNQSCSTR